MLRQRWRKGGQHARRRVQPLQSRRRRHHLSPYVTCAGRSRRRSRRAPMHPVRSTARISGMWAATEIRPRRATEESGMRSQIWIAIAMAGAIAGAPVAAGAQVMVGGAPMYRTKDIVDNAVNSKDHTTLVAAVKAAGLVPTLKGRGPFTVFAPTNAAFAALPAGTVDT